MDGSIERLLEGLEARFDALLAKEEEEAADDLASSLDRGQGLRERLSTRAGCLRVVLPDGTRLPVTEIGEDYVGCGSPVSCIAPIAASVIVLEDGVPAEANDLTLTQALRPWAESRRRVVASLREAPASYAGTLLLVASDHLVLESTGASLVIPLERLGSIRLSPEG